MKTTRHMNQSYLLMGGNEGNRLFHLEQAVANIKKFCGELLRLSSLYETAPWGRSDQPSFLNQALLIQTSLEASELMHAILQIEEKMGRKRIEKYGPRLIDIDILFFNNDIIDQPQLKIPHPEIQNRRFVLEPMYEIASSLFHPVLGKTIQELLNDCPDQLEVKKIIP